MHKIVVIPGDGIGDAHGHSAGPEGSGGAGDCEEGEEGKLYVLSV